ncbi:MAG TPA: TetR/AcrR family transcriptional regulator [Propionibacteriaceae bacterium]|nr:TetR/AcrR family transcriptional regulator [Propionibacteriaceae bacterium]
MDDDVEDPGDGDGTRSAVPDGRRTRWEEHRVQRRRDLVQATLRAIREHGHGVGMDEIAARAGTSKTVIYRHFGDRTGLWTAVVESVHDYILSNLNVPLTLSPLSPDQLVTQLADAYLAVVERDPEIYRFVVARPAGDVADPVASFTSRIGSLVADSLRPPVQEAGLPDVTADTWGHGLVGFIWAIADTWLASGMRRPRPEIVADVASLVTPAFAPLTRSQR